MAKHTKAEQDEAIEKLREWFPKGSTVFTILEQDLYPVKPDVPLAIQARAAGYLTACGLGPVRRWPY